MATTLVINTKFNYRKKKDGEIIPQSNDTISD